MEDDVELPLEAELNNLVTAELDLIVVVEWLTKISRCQVIVATEWNRMDVELENILEDKW